LQHPRRGPTTWAVEPAGAVSEYRTLDVTRAGVGKLASLIIGTGQPGQVRVGAALMILLLALVTSLADARPSAALRLGRGTFASAVFVRWAAIAAAARIESLTVCLLIVLAIF